MDYSAQSPLTCLAAVHNGSSCLSITQREAERGDKRGDGFNLWEGIKPSVALLWRGEEKKRGEWTAELSASAADTVCAGDSVGHGNMEELK